MLCVKVSGGWSRARVVDRQADAMGWDALVALDPRAALRWQHGVPRQQQAACGWNAVPALDAPGLLAWGAASQRSAEPWAQPWSKVPACDQGMQAKWGQRLRAVDVRLRLIYNPMPAARDARVRARARRSNEYGPRFDAAAAVAASLYVPGAGPLAFSFAGQRYTPPSSPLVFFDFRYEPVRAAIQPTDSARLGLRWQNARRLNRASHLPWGRARVLDGALTDMPYVDYPGPVKPLPEPPPDPSILDTYMIANTVNLVVLPSRTPIEAKNVRIGLDADSFSWTFSADIFTKAALDLVAPDEVGDNTEIELDINGWKWVVMVEGYSRQLKFPTEAYSIKGATRTQLLAGPYAPLRTGLNAAPITALQAATEQLLYTGFTLVWNAGTVGPADWTFPAGALSYQSQTAMQVIARIAETVGAVVRPARAADELEVRPRYPVPPWEWGQVDAPIDRIIPPAMMTALGGEWTPGPAWNACYVSGTSHGVSMLVRRAGTAGDNPAPDVFDDWITGEEANRARGVHELSKGGNTEIVAVSIPLFPFGDDHGVGLVLPAQLCRVPEETGPWVGLCLAVEITAAGTGASRVDQQLKLERHF
ncbi:hypothetical protein [Pseudomonas sp.]|uniref:hypothetical protein n=1 Tax=Pseudomonas sp. TaxID=306 RepID=UPI0027315711|nr:hypothetical protein [Pseudomonas sp.]MDP2444154.1 hypothetical protein [Pseudomonas sp.]MDZ4337110.1 hypothetical protein [Pseudomonas sp.]